MSNSESDDIDAAIALENAVGVSFTREVQRIVRVSFSEADQVTDFPRGITTPRLLLNLLYCGKHAPSESREVAQFARLVGHEEISLLEQRYREFGQHEDSEAQMLPQSLNRFSPESLDLLKRAAKVLDPNSAGIEPHHLLLAMVKAPTPSCRWLMKGQPEIWEDVAVTVFGYPQASSIPDGPDLNRDSRLPSPNSERSSRIKDWENHLERRFNAKFATDGVELIAAAAAQSQKIPERRPSPSGILNTRDFLPPMLNDSQLLKSLRLNSSMSVLRGGTPPPWVEELCDRDSNPDSQLAPGNLPFSRQVEEALKGAANLAASTPDYPSINKWHISGAIIASHAPGIRTALADGGTNREHALEVLLANLEDHYPEHFESAVQFLNASDAGSTLFPPLAGTNVPSDPTKSDPPGITENENDFDARIITSDQGTRPITVIASGTGLAFDRRAGSSEACLNVEKYAEALSELFRTRDEGEFVFAIYGHWGRGKTYLMEHVERMINDKELLSALDDSDKGNYETIFFSAWKYPSRPEVWVHLYETIFAKLRSHGWWRSLAHVIRAGIHNRGSHTLLFLWFTLFVAAVPKGWIVNYLPQLVNLPTTIGWFEILATVSAVVFSVAFLRSFWKTTQSLERDFLRASRHSEKLGLQATIGNDLCALLQGWIGVESETPFTIERLGVWARTWHFWKWDWNWFVRHWFMGKYGAAWSIFWALNGILCATILLRTQDAGWIGIVLSGIVLSVAIAARIAFLTSSESPKRIILVIDDLDRCELNHLLSIVESVKLLAEDSAISKRLRLSVLVEEDILNHAIWEKYQKLVREGIHEVGSKFTAEQVLRENKEKLFTAHLRLNPISKKEMGQIIEVFSKRQEEDPALIAVSSPSNRKVETDEAQELRDPTPSITEDTKGSSSATGAENQHPSEGMNNPTTIAEVDLTIRDSTKKNVTLEPRERLAILDALSNSHADLLQGLGPRSIRAYLFRYQLARLLLGKLGNKDWNPEDLAKALVHFSLSNYDLTEAYRSDDHTLISIVKEVS